MAASRLTKKSLSKEASMRFTDPQLQKLYELHLKTAPRRMSGSLATAYYRGLMLSNPSPYPTTSLAHAAWSAGRDTAKKKEQA